MKKIMAIIFTLLTAAFLVTAILGIVLKTNPPPKDEDLILAHYVGTFLPAFISFIITLHLSKK